MRRDRHSIALAIAWVLTASTGGCASKNPPPISEPAALDVPLVYSSYLEPERLNDAQRREIRAAMAGAERKAGEPWFAYVHYSGDGTYRASAYFRPTRGRGAVRRGQAILVDSEISIDRRRQIARQQGGEWPAPHPYVQLGARAWDPAAIPAEADMPFPPVDGMTDDELVKVVGAARAAAIEDDSAAGDMPIRNIELRGDGTVRVFFGWQAGGLNGRGVLVELRREGTGFAAPIVSIWVS